MKKNPLFWIGLALKLALFALVPAYYAKDLFIPFLDKAVLNFGSNPWSLLPVNHFPYGSVLFVIMALPKAIFYLLFGEASLGSTFLSYSALRLPILLADIYFFYVLLKFPSVRTKNLTWFYWLNPVLIFINYVHVQLDIFALLFLFLALNSILKKRELLSAVFVACAILCKFHVALVVPLFMVYFWNTKFKDESVKALIGWCGLLGVLVVLGFAPHLLSSNIGYVSVTSPEATRLFAMSLKLDDQHELLIGFGILAVVLMRLILASRITTQGLIYSCGIMLGLLLLTTSSMQGWYYWIYPFLALFLSQYISRLQAVIWASFLFYAIQFFPGDFDLTLPSIGAAMSFSLLQVSLLGLLLGIWVFVIRFEMPWLRRSRPLLIGIAGNSGAGKNTLSDVFFDLFGKNASSLIEGDDYHKWERGNQKWQDYTHLNPRANYLETLAQHILMLLQGQPVYKSHYDHSSGHFTAERLIATSKNIIVQGLHTLYPRVLRQIMDIKIFVGPHEQLRSFWKIRRDFKERGHEISKIISSIKMREQDASLHINPQRQFSDWILEYTPYDLNLLNINDESSVKNLDFSKEPEVFQVHYIVNDTPLDRLVDELKRVKTIKISCEPDLENLDFQRLDIYGQITAAEVEELAEKVFGNVRHLTRSNLRPQWRKNYDGINQLIFLALVQRAEMRSGQVAHGF